MWIHDNILNYETEQELVTEKVGFTYKAMNTLTNNYDKLQSDATLNTTIWDDTFEITTVKHMECKGIDELYVLNDVDTKRLNNGFRYVKELLV